MFNVCTYYVCTELLWKNNGGVSFTSEVLTFGGKKMSVREKKKIRKCLRGKKTRNQNIIQHFIEENYRCLLYTAGSVRKWSKRTLLEIKVREAAIGRYSS